MISSARLKQLKEDISYYIGSSTDCSLADLALTAIPELIAEVERLQEKVKRIATNACEAYRSLDIARETMYDDQLHEHDRKLAELEKPK